MVVIVAVGAGRREGPAHVGRRLAEPTHSHRRSDEQPWVPSTQGSSATYRNWLHRAGAASPSGSLLLLLDR